MAVVTAGPAELTDEEAVALLDALDQHATMRGAAREIGVDRWSVYRRRYRDSEFRNTFDERRRRIRNRRLRAATAELLDAMNEMARAGVEWECATDELLCLAFDAYEESIPREGLCQERLGIARRRLALAGQAWAEAVVDVTSGPRRRDTGPAFERGFAALADYFNEAEPRSEAVA